MEEASLKIAEVLGSDFLAYVAASAPEIVRHYLLTRSGLQAKQAGALEAAIDRVKSSVADDQLDNMGDETLHYFCHFALGVEADPETSLPNALRHDAGGSLPDVRPGGDMHALMAKFASEAYPYLLIGRDAGFRTGDVAIDRMSFRLRPAHALQRRLLAHPAIGQYFDTEADPKLFGSPATFSFSTGQQTTVLLYTFAPALVRTAYFNCQVRGSATHKNVIDEAVRALNGVLAMAGGAAASLPAVHILDGIVGPEDAHIETPWGIVRPVREVAGLLRPSGWHMPSDRAGTLAFVSHVEVKMRLSKGWATGEEPGLSQSPTGVPLPHGATMLRLTCALYSVLEGRPPSSGTLLRSYVRHPFDEGERVSEAAGSRSFGSRRQLNLDSPTTVEALSRAIAERHVKQLAVAASRLVSAAGHRDDPADSLIDATIAWESMVGGRGETKMRVTLALAHLLSQDPAEREQLKRQLGKLYDLRSNIVHGNPAQRSIPQADADTAISTGLKALWALYHRAELSAMSNSAERSTALLLGLYNSDDLPAQE